MSKTHDRHGYPLSPRKVNKNVWLYEQRGGVYVYIDYSDSSMGSLSAGLPWSRLCKAVDNHRAVIRRRAKP